MQPREENNTNPVDFYSLLDVNERATTDDIKNAFRSQILATHSDKVDGDASAISQRVTLLKQARDVLTNPEQRRKYDQLRQHASRPQFHTTPTFDAHAAQAGALVVLPAIDPIKELLDKEVAQDRRLLRDKALASEAIAVEVVKNAELLRCLSVCIENVFEKYPATLDVFIATATRLNLRYLSFVPGYEYLLNNRHPKLSDFLSVKHYREQCILHFGSCEHKNFGYLSSCSTQYPRFAEQLLKAEEKYTARMAKVSVRDLKSMLAEEFDRVVELLPTIRINDYYTQDIFDLALTNWELCCIILRRKDARDIFSGHHLQKLMTCHSAHPPVAKLILTTPCLHKRYQAYQVLVATLEADCQEILACQDERQRTERYRLFEARLLTAGYNDYFLSNLKRIYSDNFPLLLQVLMRCLPVSIYRVGAKQIFDDVVESKPALMHDDDILDRIVMPIISHWDVTSHRYDRSVANYLYISFPLTQRIVQEAIHSPNGQFAKLLDGNLLNRLVHKHGHEMIKLIRKYDVLWQRLCRYRSLQKADFAKMAQVDKERAIELNRELAPKRTTFTEQAELLFDFDMVAEALVLLKRAVLQQEEFAAPLLVRIALKCYPDYPEKLFYKVFGDCTFRDVVFNKFVEHFPELKRLTAENLEGIIVKLMRYYFSHAVPESGEALSEQSIGIAFADIDHCHSAMTVDIMAVLTVLPSPEWQLRWLLMCRHLNDDQRQAIDRLLRVVFEPVLSELSQFQTIGDLIDVIAAVNPCDVTQDPVLTALCPDAEPTLEHEFFRRLDLAAHINVTAMDNSAVLNFMVMHMWLVQPLDQRFIAECQNVELYRLAVQDLESMITLRLNNTFVHHVSQSREAIEVFLNVYEYLFLETGAIYNSDENPYFEKLDEFVTAKNLLKWARNHDVALLRTMMKREWIYQKLKGDHFIYTLRKHDIFGELAQEWHAYVSHEQCYSESIFHALLYYACGYTQTAIDELSHTLADPHNSPFSRAAADVTVKFIARCVRNRENLTALISLARQHSLSNSDYNRFLMEFMLSPPDLFTALEICHRLQFTDDAVAKQSPSVTFMARKR